MRAIHIRIGHDDDLVVTQLGNIEIIVNSGTKGGDHGFDLGVGIDLIQSRLLYV